MSTQANKTTARRYVEEVMNNGNIELIDELIAADFFSHGPSGVPGGGREQLKALIAALIRAIPDLRVTAEHMIAEGDLVATRWAARGTHAGELMGIAATGKELSVTTTSIDRYRDSQIVERWANQDDLGLLRQLGFVPGEQSGDRS